MSTTTIDEREFARDDARTAVLYRMCTDEHICPYGLKSKDLLQRKGYEVEDHLLRSREETDRFQEKHDVETTPQTWIDGERIGGYEALRVHFGLDEPGEDEDETTYQPVVALFSMAAAMAVAITLATSVGIGIQTVEWFVAISMCLLAVQKLRDVESFSTMFLGYDLLARRVVRYAYFYPFAEAVAGVLMLAGIATWLSAPLALFIGTVGAVSVFKAVYIDKRELKCACMGGESNVPLGFVSLTENLMMVAMALWMGGKALLG